MATILQVLALGAVDPAEPLAAAAPAPIYWRQTLFSIPFHVERPDRITQEPVEVQLHVSGDRGAHWDNWRQAPPGKGYFLFKAGIDGEYWFDVRTRDRSGQTRPQGPHTPKLVVIVDTVPPKVQLTAVRGEAGQVTATFRIEELYPKLDSLAIEYRPAPTASWQTVPVGPKDVRSHNAEHTGEVTWYPQNVSGSMEVRLRVTDMAGNPAESHTIVHPPATGGAAAANPMRSPWDVPAAATNPSSPQAAATSTPPPAAIANPAAPWQPLGPPTGRTPWPAEGARPAATETAKPPASSDDTSTGSVAIRVNPPVTQQFVGDPHPDPANPFQGFTASRPTALATMPAAAATAGPPPGVQLRWINTRVFQLTYDSHAMGAASNRPVELWGTRDGGKSWQSFGKDAKGQSPMLVTVPEDGVYGFRMALQDGTGAGRPPLPGDVPGIWIGIDLTRPVGRITRAQQGAGREGDKLFISWEASDNHELPARPISLSYSERLGGPWTSLAAGLENTGRYAWPLTGNLPSRMYLRLEIHDAAGNLGVYETPEPVTLNLSTPAAQLRDLRPLGWVDSQAAGQSYLR